VIGDFRGYVVLAERTLDQVAGYAGGVVFPFAKNSTAKFMVAKSGGHIAIALAVRMPDVCQSAFAG
jgi:hypothetical protein